MVEDLSFNVNRSRRNGFYKALIKNGIPEREQLYYTGALKIDFLDTIISDMIAKKVHEFDRFKKVRAEKGRGEA